MLGLQMETHSQGGSILRIGVRSPGPRSVYWRVFWRDLDELGDAVAVALLERAERCFLAWEMDKGERFLEQALSRVQKSLNGPRPGGAARV
jgi:hypothetical protein